MAKIGRSRALVIDLGPEGAGIEHGHRLTSDDVHLLTVQWRQPFESSVRVKHSQIRKLSDPSGPSVFHTGLEFVDLSESAAAVIDSILIDEITRKVAEWEANLIGTPRQRLPGLKLNRLRTDLPVGYVWYRLAGGEWTTSATRDPNQPLDGFAVRDDEDPAQVSLLCKTYEEYGEEDRRMLRMMAHLAIATRPGRD
jgi:hypothetical protein